MLWYAYLPLLALPTAVVGMRSGDICKPPAGSPRLAFYYASKIPLLSIRDTEHQATIVRGFQTSTVSKPPTWTTMVVTWTTTYVCRRFPKSQSNQE